MIPPIASAPSSASHLSRRCSYRGNISGGTGSGCRRGIRYVRRVSINCFALKVFQYHIIAAFCIVNQWLGDMSALSVSSRSVSLLKYQRPSGIFSGSHFRGFSCISMVGSTLVLNVVVFTVILQPARSLAFRDFSSFAKSPNKTLEPTGFMSVFEIMACFARGSAWR